MIFDQQSSSQPFQPRSAIAINPDHDHHPVHQRYQTHDQDRDKDKDQDQVKGQEKHIDHDRDLDGETEKEKEPSFNGQNHPINKKVNKSSSPSPTSSPDWSNLALAPFDQLIFSPLPQPRSISTSTLNQDLNHLNLLLPLFDSNEPSLDYQNDQCLSPNGLDLNLDDQFSHLLSPTHSTLPQSNQSNSQSHSTHSTSLSSSSLPPIHPLTPLNIHPFHQSIHSIDDQSTINSNWSHNFEPAISTDSLKFDFDQFNQPIYDQINLDQSSINQLNHHQAYLSNHHLDPSSSSSSPSPPLQPPPPSPPPPNQSTSLQINRKRKSSQSDQIHLASLDLALDQSLIERADDNKENEIKPEKRKRKVNLKVNEIDVTNDSNRKNTKNYVCTECRKTFPRLTSLTQHKLTHNGERPFRCGFEGCTKSFTTSSNSKRHWKTHFTNSSLKL
ncbi:hypothetical protein O181_061850 [Austropuccinia psidii MF-1]|uniref:C2H2-type domain-containing protein n=1 Tax=Austropuccinia psidii MF-1 TaxID=1389203 RepID=A0A9Q3EFZ3_9BASI|nr:hypothetical protein [Austropuccinia psidii MF-1]